MADQTTEQQIAFLLQMAGNGILEARQADGKWLKFPDVDSIERRIALLRREQSRPGRPATKTTYVKLVRR